MDTTIQPPQNLVEINLQRDGLSSVSGVVICFRISIPVDTNILRLYWMISRESNIDHPQLSYDNQITRRKWLMKHCTCITGDQIYQHLKHVYILFSGVRWWGDICVFNISLSICNSKYSLNYVFFRDQKE